MKVFSLVLTIAVLCVPACATTRSSTVSTTTGPSTTAASSDPRVGLASGWEDPGEAAWNLRLVSNTPPAEELRKDSLGDGRYTNSDLAFMGTYVVQGNYSGFTIWDISNPSRPTVVTAYVCPGSQNDVSVYGNLLFTSGENPNGRLDCGTQGVQDSVSTDRLRGIRIFDISDVANPKYVANVQTCRGSHTHTVVEDPNDPSHVYIYISGSAPVRSPSELPGCSSRPPDEDPNSSLFRIDVIEVPLAAPAEARIVGGARIFTELAPATRHAELREDSLAAEARRAAARAAQPAPPPQPAGPPPPRTGPSQCHDITVYSAIGLAGGACGQYGLLLDISDVANPRRVAAVADSNFAFWHSATFNNDGTKILFSDEWGGGSQPRCRVTDKPEWGADAIFTLEGHEMTYQSYYKLPAPQTSTENCVAHNGSLIPVPGRDIMVQGWYQGGISVFDWTDPQNPTEIAFFDRGPMDPNRVISAGSWSVYWYNGYLVNSEIARGLDILELVPSEHLSQNEVDAAKLVRFEVLNAQNQPKIVWPASFVVARAYLDQLERTNGLGGNRISAVRSELDRAEGLSGDERRDALTALATQLDADALGAPDPVKVRMLATAVRDLAAGQPSASTADVILSVEPDAVSADDSVALTLRNESARQVGYNLCSSELERQRDGGWQPVESNRVCTRELRILTPGEEAEYALELPEGIASGQYRYRTTVQMLDEGEAIEVRSDPFQVTSESDA